MMNDDDDAIRMVMQEEETEKNLRSDRIHM